MGKLRRILRSVFPPPRRALRAWDAWPLVLFLVLFVGGCFALDVLDLVLFSRLAPFALIVLAPWFWWMHLGGFSGLSRGRANVALFFRLLLLGVFVVLLTEPRAIRTDNRMTLVYAVDRSASIVSKLREDALGYVLRTVTTGKPEEDEAGLVVFGQNAAVELPPDTAMPFEGWINVNVQEEGTNIAKALSLSAAMLPPDRQGRILLISDGSENDGDLGAVLEDLKSKKVAVDVLGIDYKYENEVWLERLELPRSVKIGENYEADVILSANQGGTGKLFLEENGRVIFSQEVSFVAGKNRFAVPIYLREPGYYEYTAKVELPRGADSRPENNVAISFMHLKGRGRVRVVVEPGGDGQEYEAFVRVLREAGREVVVTAAYDVPRNPIAMLEDDAIVFANVGRDSFDEPQIQAIHDAVYDQGSGFLMIGGDNSFAPGGWHQTDVEKLLPVSMDISQKKRLPKGALAIVLHTCEFAEGNTWAKRITKEAVKVLSPQDEAGVLDYENGVQWVFPLTPASEYEEMYRRINAALPGDMPAFGPAMQMGLEGLLASDAATKHMIMISDCDPQPPTEALLRRFIEEKISVSIISVYPHGDVTPDIVKEISALTGGRFYDKPSSGELPSIFIKEAKTIRRVAIVNKMFVPVVENYSQVIKGIESMPELGGYVLTSAKPRSTVILKGPEKEELDPVLSVWRYGAGMAAAFTSDLSPKWGAGWIGWSQYQAFVQQLMTEVSRVEQESSLRLRSFPTEGNGAIYVEDHSPQESFMEVAAQVQLPDGKYERVALRQTGPRRYEGKFPLAGQGRYQVMAVGVGEGPEQRSHGGFVLPYSQEFKRFRSDPIVLERIARQTGGRLLTGEETGEQVFAPPREPRQSSLPIADWLLLALACAIPMDIALRRVQLDWRVIFGWFGRKAESGETMGKLLSVKKQVAATMRNEEAIQPMAAMPPVPRKPMPAAPRKPAEPLEPGGTTTSRLLNAKRRASELREKKEDET